VQGLVVIGDFVTGCLVHGAVVIGVFVQGCVVGWHLTTGILNSVEFGVLCSVLAGIKSLAEIAELGRVAILNKSAKNAPELFIR